MRYYKFSYMNNVIHEKDGVIFFDYESQMLCKLNFTTKEMLFEAHNSGGRIQISNIFKLSNQIVIMPWDGKSALIYDGNSSLIRIDNNLKLLETIYIWTINKDGYIVGFPENNKAAVISFDIKKLRFSVVNLFFEVVEKYQIQYLNKGLFLCPLVGTNKFIYYNANNDYCNVKEIECAEVIKTITIENDLIWAIIDKNNYLIKYNEGQSSICACIKSDSKFLRMIALSKYFVILPYYGCEVIFIDKETYYVRKIFLPEFDEYRFNEHKEYVPLSNCIEDEDYIYFIPWDYPFILKVSKSNFHISRVEMLYVSREVMASNFKSRNVYFESEKFSLEDYVCCISMHEGKEKSYQSNIGSIIFDTVL